MIQKNVSIIFNSPTFKNVNKYSYFSGKKIEVLLVELETPNFVLTFIQISVIKNCSLSFVDLIILRFSFFFFLLYPWLTFAVFLLSLTLKRVFKDITGN